MLKAYQFSNHAVKQQPDILDGKTPEEFLKQKYEGGPCTFGMDNLLKGGCYRVLGWSFDFTPYLTNYWYQQEHGIYSGYAPNKTMLRKAVYGRILEIRERAK